jgi:hypothetical protein
VGGGCWEGEGGGNDVKKTSRGDLDFVLSSYSLGTLCVGVAVGLSGMLTPSPPSGG